MSLYDLGVPVRQHTLRQLTVNFCYLGGYLMDDRVVDRILDAIDIGLGFIRPRLSVSMVNLLGGESRCEDGPAQILIAFDSKR